MKTLKMIFTYAIILAFGALFVIPLMWMLTVSLSDPTKVAEPGLHLFPTQLK